MKKFTLGLVRVKFLPLVGFFILTVGILAADAFSRAGGGSSYHGGSHSSSSHGSGGGGGDLFGLFYFLIRLCFQVPIIGIPLLIIVIIFLYKTSRKKTQLAGMRDYSMAGPNHQQTSYGSVQGTVTQNNSPRNELEKLKAVDPNFSLVLLDDFLGALYVEIQRAKGLGQVERLTPFLGESVAKQLMQGKPQEVRNIVIGSLRYVSVGAKGPENSIVTLVIELETNYSEGSASSPEQSYYLRERWSLERKKDVLSRTPERVSVFACPGCGAPLDQMVGGECRSCKRVTGGGNFDWMVTAITIQEKEPRGPMLTGNTQEEGNDLPTVMSADVSERLALLKSRDSFFEIADFEKRVELIYREFQKAWSARDLAPMVPFLSDNLLRTQTYWIQAYKQQKLKNLTDGAQITGMKLVRITNDKFYDSITLRLWAKSLDYTVNEQDQLVSGSRSQVRAYTEYWTFIRGSLRTGKATTEANCPSCGAQLKINMAGACEYCRAKVNSGDFDWVLSRIEQDDSYV